MTCHWCEMPGHAWRQYYAMTNTISKLRKFRKEKGVKINLKPSESGSSSDEEGNVAQDDDEEEVEGNEELRQMMDFLQECNLREKELN